MGNELDHTIVEPQPCPNECGRIHAGHYTNITDLIKAWNGSKEGE